MSNNIINISAAREAWAENWKKIIAIVSILLALYFGWSHIQAGWQRLKVTPAETEKYPAQYILTVLEQKDTHRLLLCSATYVADDMMSPVGSLYGQIYIPYSKLTDIPQRGETFRLMKGDDEKFRPIMMSGPPQDSERNAPVAKPVAQKVARPQPTPAKLARPTATPTPPPKR